MKTKFLLIFLSLNGLVLSATNASAYSHSPDRDVARLSQQISELVDLDRDTYSLVEMAIDRALLAKNPSDNSQSTSAQQSLIAERTIAPSDTNTKRTGANPNSQPVIAGGKNIYTPPKPIINGRIIRPNYPRPVINGTVIADPKPQPVVEDKPLINGLIIKPNQK
jgi:hypothetical protein